MGAPDGWRSLAGRRFAPVISCLLVNALRGVLQSQTVTGSFKWWDPIRGSPRTGGKRPRPPSRTTGHLRGRSSPPQHLRWKGAASVLPFLFTRGPYQEVDIQSQVCSSANWVQEDQSETIRIAPRGRITSARRRLSSICSLVKRAETFRMRAAFHGITERGGGGGAGLWHQVPREFILQKEGMDVRAAIRFTVILPECELWKQFQAARHAERKMMS